MVGEGLLAIAVIWIVLAIGVGLDARERGGDGTVWFLVVAFFGVFGVFAYAILHMVRKQTEGGKPVFKVSSKVMSPGGEITNVKLTARTSKKVAIQKFKQKCSEESYIIAGEPNVEIKI
jgi:hypothetical protein